MKAQQMNKIRGQHIRKKRNGECYLYPKEYVWHIPKDMRKKIEIGDTVEVIGSDDWVKVTDVFFADEPKTHQAIYRIIKKRPTTFGDQLKKYRKKNRLNQTQLAEILDVSLETINSWERNKTKPQKRYHSRIEEKLAVKVSDYLLKK